jgi:hypothetical protein
VTRPPLPRALPRLPERLHDLLTIKGDISTAALLAEEPDAAFEQYLANVEQLLAFRAAHELSWGELRAMCRAEARRIDYESRMPQLQAVDLHQLAQRRLEKLRAAYVA